jgi:hypothetical protein
VDLPYPIFRIWTDPRTSESLPDIFRWPWLRIMQANEWLNILDNAEEKARREAERKSKLKK